jgi:hypothetical protein
MFVITENITKRPVCIIPFTYNEKALRDSKYSGTHKGDIFKRKGTQLLKTYENWEKKCLCCKHKVMTKIIQNLKTFQMEIHENNEYTTSAGVNNSATFAPFKKSLRFGNTFNAVSMQSVLSFLFLCTIRSGDQLFAGLSGCAAVLVLILWILRCVSSAYLVNGEVLTFLVLLSNTQRYNISHIYLIKGEISHLPYFSRKRLVGITPMVRTYTHT